MARIRYKVRKRTYGSVTYGYRSMVSSRGKHYLVKTIGKRKIVKFRKNGRDFAMIYKIKNPGRRR